MRNVYIRKAAAFLPNEAIENNEMETYLGYLNGKPSRAKAIILSRNGIKKRYYALDKEGKTTHTNAELTAEAVRALFDDPAELKSIDLLTCGTSTPDQMLPSHAVMVHGCLPESSNIEVVSPSGACCSGMHAFKYAYMALKLGDKTRAVSTGSERVAVMMTAKNYEEEVKELQRLESDSYIAFEKDFLRWMLSDGAGAFLMETEAPKEGDELALRIDWIEGVSYANLLEPCMYMAADKEDGTLVSYKEYDSIEQNNRSIFAMKQDVKLLGKNIVELGSQYLKAMLEKHGKSVEEVDYFLPHLSSYFFQNPIFNSFEAHGIPIAKEKWFTNLQTKGNVGSGSIYLMVEELLNGGQLKKGDQLLLAVPESARFSYIYAWLTVC